MSSIIPDISPGALAATGVRILKGGLLGGPPRAGQEPMLASQEVAQRAAGEGHLVTEKGAETLDRLALGLPVGTVGRALTGTEGLGLALQGPAFSGANVAGRYAWRGARAATGAIPRVSAARTVGAIKTKGVRRMLAEQQEQQLSLAEIAKRVKAEAKAQGLEPEPIDSRVREARMLEPMDNGNAMAALTPGEQAIAQAYKDFEAAQVQANLAQKMKPGIRHAHILRAREKALEAIGDAKVKRQIADEMATAEIPAPFGRPAGGLQEGEIGLKSFVEGRTQRPQLVGSPPPQRGPDIPPQPQRFVFDPETGQIVRRTGPIPAETAGPAGVRFSGSALDRARQIADAAEMEATKAVNEVDKYLRTSGLSAPRGMDRRIDLASAEQYLQRLPEMLTGHAPILVTPEARTAMRELRGLAPEAAGVPLPRFTVSRVPRIRGSAAKTAGEKEASYLEKMAAERPGVEAPRFQFSQLEAALVRADQRAAKRATAGMLDDLSRLGVEVAPGAKVPAGYTMLSEIRTGKTGLQAAELKRLSKIAIPTEHFRKARGIFEVINNPSSLGEAKNFVSKAGQYWKGAVLFRGGYTARNVYDNVIAAAQAGAKPKYALWGLKASLLAHGIEEVGAPLARRLGFRSGFKINPDQQVPGLGMTLREYVADARRTGELTGGFMTRELGALEKAAPVKRVTGPVLRGWRNINAVLENSSRSALGMSKRSVGWTREETGQLVDDILGKYHPAFQNRFVRKVGEYGFPWVNWMVQIGRRSLRLGLERPGSVAAVAAIPAAVNLSQGFTPADVDVLGPSVRQSGAIVRPRGPKNVEVTSTSFYGPTDINRMLGLGERGPAQIPIALGRQAWPPYSWAAAATGTNPVTGKPFTGQDVVLPWAGEALLKAAPRTAASLGIRKIGDQVLGPDRLDFILRQNPLLIAAAIGGLNSPDPEARRSALSMWTGISSWMANLPESKRIQRGVVRRVSRSEQARRRMSGWNVRRALQRQRREAEAESSLVWKESPPSGNEARPIIINRDGSFSTELTITIEVDGRYLNIPTIVGGIQRSTEEAIQLYRLGANPAVGSFGSEAEALDSARRRSEQIGRTREAEAESLLTR